LIALECHRGSRSAAVQRIGVEAVRDGGMLRLRYVIECRVEALRLPPRGLRPLWQHTCCEAFVGSRASPAYHEFNFSPSGDWDAYAFTDYRRGGPLDVPDPDIAVKVAAQAIELSAAVRAAAQPLLLALSAVVEARDGSLSYWALRHAPGQPDFHHRDGFVLELA
jgi:hypothetical protein